jgi:mannose-6-phosphate isomerase
MSAGQRGLGPIKLQPTLHETIWGGRNLAAIAGKHLAPDVRVGESWETELGNLAVNEPFLGSTLGQLVDELGVALVGEQSVKVVGRRFPLLAKFIDAQDTLSVQVHPDDSYAHEHEGGKLGKTEAWYILHAEPRAQLVYGLNRPASQEDVRQAIAETRLEGLLHSFTVRPGDVVYVPAGTVHAIGAGVVLYEIQEYSDVTYRLYDFGRLQPNGQRRELHVDRGLAVMRYEPPQTETVRPVAAPDETPGVRGRVLVACQYFMLEEIVLMGLWPTRTQRTSCDIVSLLGGTCEISTPGGFFLRLDLGDTVVLPADLGSYTLVGDSARFLRSYVPTPDDRLWRLWQQGQSGVQNA